MEEPADEARLEPSTVEHAAAASEDNIRSKQCVNLSIEDMDNKENLYTASSNRYGLAAVPQAMPQTGMAKKAGHRNLRKSLAWNKAFFTEEGVLDPSELSILCGSATKSSASFLTDVNEDFSPLKSCDFSATVNSHAEVHLGSALRDKKPNDLLSTLDQPRRIDGTSNEVPEKTILIKSTCRSIPRAPSTYSQKRAANTNTSNPASKLPKFTATTSNESSLASTLCSAPTKLSNQNVKPAKLAQNAKSKSSLTMKKDFNCPTLSAKISEHTVKKKTVNETCELPFSVDTWTLDLRRQTSSLRKPQNQIPSTSLSTTAGISSFENIESVCPNNAGNIQRGHNPAQSQSKASGLRMPTPSLGFFCPAKNRPLVQKESQASHAIVCNRQTLSKPNRPTLMNNFRTLQSSHGPRQRCGSTREKGNPTASPDIDLKASSGKTSRHCVKPLISSCQQNGHKELQSVYLMNEGNREKESVEDGQTYVPESLNSVELSTQSCSLVGERKSVNTLVHSRSSDISSKWEDTCETSVPPVCKGSVDGKLDLPSGLAFANNHEIVDECSSLEVETTLGSRKTKMGGSASLQLPCSSSENVILSVETENTECAVPLVEQCGMNTDTVILEEVQRTQPVKRELQHSEVLHQGKKHKLASQCKSEEPSKKEDSKEKPKHPSILLNQLKAAPFSEEWLAALETFGEDILRVKSGAVQNSPTEKPNPEPSPWSPVKRKNKDVGPYDCTKYTKNLSTPSTSL